MGLMQMLESVCIDESHSRTVILMGLSEMENKDKLWKLF